MASTIFPNSTPTILLFNLSVTIFPTITHHRYFNVPGNIPVSVKFSLGVLLAIGVISGVSGNILVLCTIFRNKTLGKHRGNVMILNLAVADLLMASLPMPVLGAYFALYWPEWPFGEILCRVTVFITNVSGCVSVLTMVFIALDRYFVIVRNKSILKRRNLNIVLCSSWFISAAGFMSRLARKGITKHSLENGDFNVCFRMDSMVLLVKSKKYLSFSIQIFGVLMQVVLMLIYVRIGVFLYKSQRRIQDMSRWGEKRETRALKLMFSIVLTFCFCWLPYVVVNFMRIFPVSSDTLYVDPAFMLTAYSLGMFNSSLNPLLYALVSKNFRNAYRETFQMCFRKGMDTS